MQVALTAKRIDFIFMQKRWIMNWCLKIFVLVLVFISLYGALSAEDAGSFIVYTRSGCLRCEITIDFLRSHDMNFSEYSVEDEKNNQNMWKSIHESCRLKGDRITIPVIIRKGVVYFIIENLEGFLRTLTIH